MAQWFQQNNHTSASCVRDVSSEIRVNPSPLPTAAAFGSTRKRYRTSLAARATLGSSLMFRVFILGVQSSCSRRRSLFATTIPLHWRWMMILSKAPDSLYQFAWSEADRTDDNAVKITAPTAPSKLRRDAMSIQLDWLRIAEWACAEIFTVAVQF